MSVDLVASLRRPITLSAVTEQGRRTLSELLGIAAVPELEVFAGREHVRGERVDPGRRLDAAELDATILGRPIAPDSSGSAGAEFFDVDLPVTGDGVRLMVFHKSREDAEDTHQAVFSPYRTCVGVTVATGLALATAALADGEYVDQEIFMLTPPVHNPEEVIRRTRLKAGSGDFAARCERYLRQFPELGSWPPDRSTR